MFMWNQRDLCGKNEFSCGPDSNVSTLDGVRSLSCLKVPIRQQKRFFKMEIWTVEIENLWQHHLEYTKILKSLLRRANVPEQ